MDTHALADVRQIVWSRFPSPEGGLSPIPVESPCAVDKYRKHREKIPEQCAHVRNWL
jgi:hypothetical protein